jgi:hypothetical protein
LQQLLEFVHTEFQEVGNDFSLLSDTHHIWQTHCSLYVRVVLVKLKTLHSVCLLADCLQCKYCYYMLYLLCSPTSKKSYWFSSGTLGGPGYLVTRNTISNAWNQSLYFHQWMHYIQ